MGSPSDKAKAVFRRGTAPLRPLPDVLFIGGIRCGSWSLFQHLAAAGCVGALPPTRKEIHFFDRSFEKGPTWYRSRFPLTQRRLIVDPTPSYLCTPGVAERAAQVVPDAKIVVVLRDPSERARSHFAWRRSRGMEPAPDLLTAIGDEPARRLSGLAMLGCYDLHSRYDAGLRAWAEHFPKDRICVLRAEGLFSNDPDEFRRVDEFLGIEVQHEFPIANVGVSSTAPEVDLGHRFDDVIAGVEEFTGRSMGWTTGNGAIQRGA